MIFFLKDFSLRASSRFARFHGFWVDLQGLLIVSLTVLAPVGGRKLNYHIFQTVGCVVCGQQFLFWPRRDLNPWHWGAAVELFTTELRALLVWFLPHNTRAPHFFVSKVWCFWWEGLITWADRKCRVHQLVVRMPSIVKPRDNGTGTEQRAIEAQWEIAKSSMTNNNTLFLSTSLFSL